MNLLVSKLTASVLAISLTLSCSLALAADKKTVSAIPRISAQQLKKTTSFLFVIDAKQGEIKNINGQLNLVLKNTDMNNVIMFSYRPNRIVKYITGKQLKSIWKVGKNSFEKNPPNAVLSTAEMQSSIITINSIHVKQDHVEMIIKFLSSPIKNNGDIDITHRNYNGISLVIDNWQDKVTWWCKGNDGKKTNIYHPGSPPPTGFADCEANGSCSPDGCQLSGSGAGF